MSAPPSAWVSLLDSEPEGYACHPVHGTGRVYHETNCYTDVLLELLHARGHEPLAAMGFTVRQDFEGDQWTFFKPPPGDLELLFGVEVHEMQPYRPLEAQLAEQLRQGRTMIVEVDAWWLPDTAATSYRSEHVKTSVAVAAIDPAARRLRYFHNAGLYELEGEDYEQIFIASPSNPSFPLPPYAELVRFDAGAPLEGDALLEAARERLAWHVARRPPGNPFDRFAEGLERELPALLEGDAAHYHAYAFATVRMSGSAFELLASHLDWLYGEPAAEAVAALGDVVSASQVLGFKLARRRAFDAPSAVSALGEAWDRAMTAVAGLL